MRRASNGPMPNTWQTIMKCRETASVSYALTCKTRPRLLHCLTLLHFLPYPIQDRVTTGATHVMGYGIVNWVQMRWVSLALGAESESGRLGRA